MRSQFSETVRLELSYKNSRKKEDLVFTETQKDINIQKAYHLSFPGEKLQKTPVRTRNARPRIWGCSAMSKGKSRMIRAVPEGFSGY